MKKKMMMMTNMNIITIITIMPRKTNMSIITMTTMNMTTTTMSMSIITITIIITTTMTMIMKAEKLRNTESVHLSTTVASLSTWVSSMIS